VRAPRGGRAGRSAGAVAGWLACLALWGLGAALYPIPSRARRARDTGPPPRPPPAPGGPGRRGRTLPPVSGAVGSVSGAAAALLLASHPLWLANSRRAGLDAPALALGLLAALLAVLAVRRWPGDAARGGPGVGGRRATNPALYRDPAGGLRASLDFLTVQARDMRWQSPVFRYRPLVAVEVLDRTVWPLGFPAVTDETLPEPLSPGSYGAPVVALGALGALLVLLSRPADRRPALLAAAAWTALVYLALVWSVPIWWERWHLPLVLPLCLLAGLGLAALARGSLLVALVPAGAQYVAALAMGPSYLGNGFGALLGTPVGLAAHLLALTWLLVHFWAQARSEGNWRQRWQTAPQRGELGVGASGQPATGSCASASSAAAESRRERTSPVTRIPRESSSTPPAT
jgi:hypothetical protein